MAVAQYIGEAPVGDWWINRRGKRHVGLTPQRNRTEGKFRAEWTYSKGRVAPHQ